MVSWIVIIGLVASIILGGFWALVIMKVGGVWKKDDRAGGGFDLEGSPCGITDLEGTVQYWSKEAERLTGFRKSSAEGQKLSDFLVPNERLSEIQECWGQVVRSKEPVTIKGTERFTSDGKRIVVDITVSPVIGPKGETIALFGAMRLAGNAQDRNRRHARERIR